MSIKQLTSNYTAYNLWANELVVDWLRTIDAGLLYKTTPSSYDSLDYTLQHILRVQGYWMKFITGADHLNHNWDVREREVANIMEELLANSVAMKNQILAYSETELLQVLHLDTAWAKNALPRYEYIMHAVNHNTYHRGQVITMARSLGITQGVVNTDYNIFNTIEKD